MEAALWTCINSLAPGIRPENIAAGRGKDGDLVLRGELDIRHATLFNIAIHKFMQRHADTYGLSGKVSRKQLEIFVPQVRLGDVVKTERERQILAAHTENDNYLDPNALIDVPEWNSDFVRASDRRHRDHIKPRYAKDDDQTIDAVAAFIAEFCRKDDGIVVHTGAGISAAAGIATYREGSNASISISAAMPTYAHYALVAMTKKGAVDYICSQNVDGLHRRSGIAAERLSELHGNSYIETCKCCSPPMEFVRPYDVYSTQSDRPQYWARYVRGADGQRQIESNTALTQNERKSGIHHITGRACPCGGGPLRDSIIHFGESLPVAALQEGERRSTAAPLNLVMGCSLLVQPAASLPFKNQGPVAIVSLTCTGSDMKALRRGGVLLHAPADLAMERIIYHLGAFQFPNTPALVQQLHERVKARDQAVLFNSSDTPYDGGADGGVFPDFLISDAPAMVENTSVLPLQMDALPLQLHQTHEPSAEGWHRWSLSLQGDEHALQAVKAVRFELHPTFDPPVYEVETAPFTVGPFVGWGTFDVKVCVKMKAGLPDVKAKFPLSFSGSEKTMKLATAGGA
mmetsp:Transcript_127333/g.220716  ORF Transcript_127333/g.220716 Transcript_127333/m.220716 type:complete len:573 (-) Transcript_127333:297-2015(-)